MYIFHILYICKIVKYFSKLNIYCDFFFFLQFHLFIYIGICRERERERECIENEQNMMPNYQTKFQAKCDTKYFLNGQKYLLKYIVED